MNPGPTCQTLVIILGRNVGWFCIETCDIVTDFSIGPVLERTCITKFYVCFQHAYWLNSLESRSHRSQSSHYSGQEYWLVLDRDL